MGATMSRIEKEENFKKFQSKQTLIFAAKRIPRLSMVPKIGAPKPPCTGIPCQHAQITCQHAYKEAGTMLSETQAKDMASDFEHIPKGHLKEHVANLVQTFKLADEAIKYLQGRKWTDSAAARSSEGKNHDTEISPSTSELLFKGLQSRKWTDSTAARSSEGKNHGTELSPISSELLNSMDKFLPLLIGLLTMFHFVLFGISQIGVGYLVLFFIISKFHIIKIKRQEPDSAAVLNEMKSIIHYIAQQAERMSSLDKKNCVS